MSELVMLAAPRRERLNRRARYLAWATIGYNAVEGLVALAAGVVASSAALVSFGLDSAIEVSSAVAVAWQFAHHVPEERERRTLRLVALSFLALAAWVTVDAVRGLVGAGAEPSAVGIALRIRTL
jgi:hypothetical protein